MKRNLIFIFFVAFFAAFIYLNVRGIHHYSDNDWFSKEAHTSDIFSWLITRYQVWSSRTPIEYALLTLINHKQTWAIFNSFFIAITVCSFSYISSSSKKELIYSSLLFLLFIVTTIKKDFIKDGILWMTGSINYLWPFALSIAGFALLKSIKTNNSSHIKTFSIPFMIFLSSFSEQMVVVNIILLSVIALSCKGVIRRISIMTLITSSLALLYILLSPGNTMRLHMEIPRWNPDFVNLNIFEKLVMGMNLSYDQMFSVQPVSLIAIYLCLYLIFLRKSLSRLVSLALLIMSILLTVIQKKLFTILDFDTIYQFCSQNVDGYLSLARTSLILILSASTTILLFILQKERRMAWILSATYVVSYSGTVMLGLSPTIYASGQRVLMVSGLMTSALAAYLVVRTIAHLKSARIN